jgi:hypothetical protein
MLLLIFPLQKLAAFPKYIIAVSIGLVLVARHIPEFSVVGISSAALLRWQFGFVSGYSLALMSEFDVGGILRMVRMPIAVCTIGAIYLIHKSLGGTVALLLLPFFVWGLKIIFENMPYRNMLEFLGKKSMPMWLLHPFIVYYIFAEQLFSLSNALVIYLALVFGTIIIALPLEWGRIRLINQENDSINTIRKGAA